MIDFKPSINFWHDFKSNQIAGMWLFLGSRRSLQLVRPSIMQLVFWGILGGCANSLFSWLSSGRMGDFNSQGLISYALWPFIALIVGIFLSQRINNLRLMLVPALLWLVLDTHIMLFQCLIQYLGDLDYLPYILYDYIPTLFVMLFVWQSLAVVWVISRELKWPWWERALIMLATLFTLVVWQISVKDQPIWKVEEIPPSFAEDAFYAQPILLNKALENIEYGEFAQSHWYFMGVAGASYQDVFHSEIERIKEQFDTRFGTYGRSIALVNHPATRTTLPIASKTSMELALRRMGQQMNRESDVLFLYMTSHGLPNVFEMENAPLDFLRFHCAGRNRNLPIDGGGSHLWYHRGGMRHCVPVRIFPLLRLWCTRLLRLAAHPEVPGTKPAGVSYPDSQAGHHGGADGHHLHDFYGHPDLRGGRVGFPGAFRGPCGGKRLLRPVYRRCRRRTGQPGLFRLHPE